jgi:MFS family permease
MKPRRRPPSVAGIAARMARLPLACYPPAWRERYGAEMRALVDDTGADARTITSLVWGAVAVWAGPPRHLHDPSARVRASLATVLAAWAALAGLGLVFGQLSEAQGLHTITPDHPFVQWSYSAYAVAAHVSVAVVLLGGFPLLWSMLRLARLQGRRRDLALLAMPAIVPAGFFAALIVTAKLVRRGGGIGIGPWWFLAFTVLGFAAAGLAAAGPGLALRRLRPGGSALRLAAVAAVVAVLTMGAAGAASITDAVGLYLWAPSYGGYRAAWLLASYLSLVLLAMAIASISSVRAARAAWAMPDRA